MDSLKRPNTFLSNLKTKEELVRDEISKEATPAEALEEKWMSAQEIINLKASSGTATSYADTVFKSLNVPNEIPYEDNGSSDITI